MLQEIKSINHFQKHGLEDLQLTKDRRGCCGRATSCDCCVDIVVGCNDNASQQSVHSENCKTHHCKHGNQSYLAVRMELKALVFMNGREAVLVSVQRQTDESRAASHKGLYLRFRSEGWHLCTNNRFRIVS